jgi:large subunit ribosomal protein L30
MQFDEFINKKIVVSQVKSGSKFNKRQQGTLIGLGLRGIGSSSTFQGSQEIVGMIRKVGHAVKVSLA